MVTATRRPVRQHDTTATTYTVKKEDFKAQGAVTATDALQLVPGFIGSPSLGGVRNAGGNVFNLTDTQYEYLDSNPAPGTTFRVGTLLEIGGRSLLALGHASPNENFVRSVYCER